MELKRDAASGRFKPSSTALEKLRAGKRVSTTQTLELIRQAHIDGQADKGGFNAPSKKADIYIKRVLGL